MTKYLMQSPMCMNIDKEERFSSQLKHIHDIIDHTCPFLSYYCKSRPGFLVQVAYKIDTAAFSPSKKTADNETSPSDVSKWSWIWITTSFSFLLFQKVWPRKTFLGSALIRSKVLVPLHSGTKQTGFLKKCKQKWKLPSLRTFTLESFAHYQHLPLCQFGVVWVQKLGLAFSWYHSQYHQSSTACMLPQWLSWRSGPWLHKSPTPIKQ